MSIDEMMDLGFSDWLINQLTEVTNEMAGDVQQITSVEGDYTWIK